MYIFVILTVIKSILARSAVVDPSAYSGHSHQAQVSGQGHFNGEPHHQVGLVPVMRHRHLKTNSNQGRFVLTNEGYKLSDKFGRLQQHEAKTIYQSRATRAEDIPNKHEVVAKTKHGQTNIFINEENVGEENANYNASYQYKDVSIDETKSTNRSQLTKPSRILVNRTIVVSNDKRNETASHLLTHNTRNNIKASVNDAKVMPTNNRTITLIKKEKADEVPTQKEMSIDDKREEVEDRWIWSQGDSETTTVITNTDVDLGDRASFEGDLCATGKIRFEERCVDVD